MYSRNGCSCADHGVWPVAGLILYGLFLGDKAASDALLQRSGMLNVSGAQFVTYVEQPYIKSMLQFLNETQGKAPCTAWPAPSCRRSCLCICFVPP